MSKKQSTKEKEKSLNMTKKKSPFLIFPMTYWVMARNSRQENSCVLSLRHVCTADVPPELLRPLYDGSRITIYEHLVSMLVLSVRYGWGKQETTDILQQVALATPDDSNCCKTHHKLLRSFQDSIGSPTRRHYTCPVCQKRVLQRATECSDGHEFSKPSYFVSMDIEKDIKLRMKGSYHSVRACGVHVCVPVCGRVACTCSRALHTHTPLSRRTLPRSRWFYDGRVVVRWSSLLNGDVQIPSTEDSCGIRKSAKCLKELLPTSTTPTCTGMFAMLRGG